MQSPNDLATPTPIPASGNANHAFLTTPEFILAASVLIFGAVVLALLFIFLRKNSASPDDALRTVSVTLIIIGSLFCMAAGFDEKQIAPIIGLFGTIIGYVVGRRDRSSKKETKNRSDGEVSQNA